MGARCLWLLFAGVAITVIVLLVFCAYYASFRAQVKSAPPTPSARQSQGAIRNVVIALFSFILFLVVSMVSMFFAVWGIRRIEQRNLFVPTKIERYEKLSGVLYTLPSGALLLHTTPNAAPNARRILFLHGNTGNLDYYKDALDKIGELGYDVWSVEYVGYGPTRSNPGEPNPDSVCRDSVEAWQLMGTADGIVIGFSLGGGILGQIYERLIPQPSTIVFLNTFGSTPRLISDKLGDFGDIVAPFMANQWVTKAPTTYTGKVVVVFSLDDCMITKKHSENLCAVFSKADLVCRELPRGGHKLSGFLFLQHWIAELPPP